MDKLPSEQMTGALCALAGDMLFPAPTSHQEAAIIRNLESPAAIKNRQTRTAKKLALASTNQSNRWAYITDQRIKNLHLKISFLNNASFKNVPFPTADSSGVIELVQQDIDADIVAPLLIFPRDLLTFLDRAPPQVCECAKRQSIHGQVAGSLLWYAYHLNALTSSASLNRAMKLAQHFYPKRFSYGAGRPQVGDDRFAKSYSTADLRRVWDEFGSVAHLWAAWLAINDDVMLPTDEPLADIDHVAFVGLSERFAQFGLNSVSRHNGARTPLLKDSLLVSTSATICNEIPPKQTIPINDEIMSFVLAGANEKR